MVLVLTQTHWSIIFITAFRSRLQAELGDATSSEERYWFIWCNPTSLQGNWYQVLFLIYFISNCNNLARFVTYVKNFLIINRWSLWTTIITWFVFYWLLSLKDLGNNCTDFLYTLQTFILYFFYFCTDLIQVLWTYFYGTKQFLARKCGITSSLRRRFGDIRKGNRTNAFADVTWLKRS